MPRRTYVEKRFNVTHRTIIDQALRARPLGRGRGVPVVRWMMALAVLALAVSIWASYVGVVSHPNSGVAGTGGLCIVASAYLIVDTWRRR